MSALIKDILREVRKTFGRFFAIFAIVLIGVAFFAGVTASSADMKHSADKYYDDYNLYDLYLMSNVGLNDSDVEDIRGLEGVKSVLPAYSKDMLAKVDTSYDVFKLMSIPEDNPDGINSIRIKEGRLPEKSGECVVKYETIRGTDMKIGDKLVFESGDDSSADSYLKTTEYTIVGFIYTPVYMSYELGSSGIGNGTVSYIAMIPEEDFNMPVYTECYITAQGTKELNSYENESYDSIVEAVKTRIEELGKEEKEADAFYPIAREWYCLDRDYNYAVVSYESSANQMADIAAVFPVFFFFVAALVCLTTMTRMVDEQRGIIGTYKALGYSKLAIASKYVMYALTASLFGGILGCIVGNYVFPMVIYYCWTIVYQMPDIAFADHLQLNIVAVVSMTMITVLATVWACYRELVAQPSVLMRPKAPRSGKKILLERCNFIWSRFSFILKVTARNIFRYKKRFFMTLIGIAGCTALLLAGFGIKNSIQGLIRKQFEEIFKYNVTVSLDKNAGDEEADSFYSEFTDRDDITQAILLSNGKVSLMGEEKEITATMYAADGDKPFMEYIYVRRSKNEPCTWDASGVIITSKAAADLGLKVGDELLMESGDIRKKVRIADIAEMYVGHFVFMQSEYYEQIFGEKLPDNMILGVADCEDKVSENTLASECMDKDIVENVVFMSGDINRFNDMIESLGLVTLVLIISAGALAFVVLYNLTNVNISERIREIATIKVLGFYDKEVSAYVYRENVAITILGAICGLGLGKVLHAFIMKTIELEDVTFGNEIYFISYVLSFLITMVFSVIVNLVMNRKMKNIQMVESLKSVE